MRSVFRSLDGALAYLETRSPGAYHLVVLHDDDCLHGRDHGCTCRADYVVEPLDEQVLIDGARGSREWLERHRRN